MDSGGMSAQDERNFQMDHALNARNRIDKLEILLRDIKEDLRLRAGMSDTGVINLSHSIYMRLMKETGN